MSLMLPTSGLNYDESFVEVSESNDLEVYKVLTLHKDGQSISLDLSEVDSRAIAEELDSEVYVEVERLKNTVTFKEAQISCIKGEVALLEIVKVSDTAMTGFKILTFNYYEDVDLALLHSVENVQTYVPHHQFSQEEQFSWLRGLVGGQHQYTTTIKIKLEGFTFQEIDDEFAQALTDRLE